MNKKSPKVSVIIPNYNHAKYLDQRIQSVLNQTFRDFEVIILDDKSPDHSVEVIQKYASDPHVSHIVVNEVNSGSTFIQWRRGFGLAKGEYIWIAESDDFCSPDFLGKCVEKIEENPKTAVVYCSSEYVDAEGEDLGTYNPYSKEEYHMSSHEFINKRMAFGCAIWNASSALFRKDYALAIDRQYENYKACGDKLFWIEMAENGDVVHVNRIMNYFRQHQNKVSPRRFRDGTSLREEREIYLYQCRNGYLRGFKRAFILKPYYDKIITGDFESLEIKNGLLALWGFNRRRKINIISSISRLYQYFYIYILRKKPI